MHPADFEGAANAKPPPLAEEEEERGWLDHVEAMEGGFARLTKILEEISTDTQQIGEAATLYTERIERAKESSEPNKNAQLRFIVSEYGRILGDYGRGEAPGAGEVWTRPLSLALSAF